MRNSERESPKSGPPMGLMQHVCCRAIFGWRWQMLSELRPADRSCLIQLNLCKFSVWGRFYKREHEFRIHLDYFSHKINCFVFGFVFVRKQTGI